MLINTNHRADPNSCQFLPGANHHRSTEEGHWIEVIASIYKIGNTLDVERETAIRQKYISGGTTQV